MRKIQVTVNKDGTTSTDFDGFAGPTCLAEAEKLRELLAALGVKMQETNFIPKPELSISESTVQRQTETQ